MQHVIDHVDAAYLEQSPPRALPPSAVFSLTRSHMLRRRYAILDPRIILGVALFVALWLLGAPAFVLLVPVLIMLWQVGRGVYWLTRHVRDDVALLRKGQIITAEVQKLRPHRALNGNIEGALIDCVIAVAPRRTYIGSVWLADGQEALRLAQQGRVEVLCLPRAPGTWRIIEKPASAVLYERVGAMAEIPTEVE